MNFSKEIQKFVREWYTFLIGMVIKKTKVQSFGLSIFTEKIKDVFFTVLPGEKEESSLLKLHNVGVEYSSRFSTLFFFVGLEMLGRIREKIKKKWF